MKSINIHEAKTKLSSLLTEIEKGGESLICRNGVPVADLLPHKKRKRTKKHPILSKFKINKAVIFSYSLGFLLMDLTIGNCHAMLPLY